MKILVCTPEYPPLYSSGIGNVVYSLKRELELLNIDFDICSTIGSDIELCVGPISKKFVNFRSIYVSYYWYLAKNYVSSNSGKYDLIWVHDPMPFFLNKIPKDTPLLITFHTILSNYLEYSRYPRPILKYIKKLERNALENCTENTAIVAVSKKVADEILQLGANRRNVCVIPNGISTDEFKPSQDKMAFRKMLGLPEKDIILLSLGKIKEQKQPLKLIKIFSELEKRINNIHLIVIGKGHLLEKMKSYSNAIGIKNVTYLGYVSSTKEFYAASDYFIMTSSYEGLPLTVLEAMSSGLPCIVSNIPNLKFVEESGSGITINPDDTHSCADKMIELFKSNDVDLIAENARSFCLKFDWSKIAELYSAEFLKLKK